MNREARESRYDQTIGLVGCPMTRGSGEKGVKDVKTRPLARVYIIAHHKPDIRPRDESGPPRSLRDASVPYKGSLSVCSSA